MVSRARRAVIGENRPKRLDRSPYGDTLMDAWSWVDWVVLSYLAGLVSGWAWAMAEGARALRRMEREIGPVDEGARRTWRRLHRVELARYMAEREQARQPRQGGDTGPSAAVPGSPRL